MIFRFSTKIAAKLKLYGRGIANDSYFIERASISPASATVRFSKALKPFRDRLVGHAAREARQLAAALALADDEQERRPRDG